MDLGRRRWIQGPRSDALALAPAMLLAALLVAGGAGRASWVIWC